MFVKVDGVVDKSVVLDYFGLGCIESEIRCVEYLIWFGFIDVVWEFICMIVEVVVLGFVVL